MLVDRRAHDDEDVIAVGQILRGRFHLKAECQGACQALLETFISERHFPVPNSVDSGAVDVIEEYAMMRSKSYPQRQPDVTAPTHDHKVQFWNPLLALKQASVSYGAQNRGSV